MLFENNFKINFNLTKNWRRFDFKTLYSYHIIELLDFNQDNYIRLKLLNIDDVDRDDLFFMKKKIL